MILKKILKSWAKALEIIWKARFEAHVQSFLEMAADKAPIPKTPNRKYKKARQLVTLALLAPFGLDKWCATKKFGWEIGEWASQ